MGTTSARRSITDAMTRSLVRARLFARDSIIGSGFRSHQFLLTSLPVRPSARAPARDTLRKEFVGGAHAAVAA